MKLSRLIILFLYLPLSTLAQKAGAVTDTIPCKKSPDQTYALYLPKSYSATSSHGLILFLDPGAEGKYPVDLYKSIADKYSLILVGSNNSKNGAVDPSLRAGNAVLEDALSRFNIDGKFIIASGFSGGSRSATDLATRNRTFTGIIGCGASFNMPKAISMERPIPYAEVIGQLEMNYQEALWTSEYLQTIHNPSSLTLFYAYHQWPPVEAYEDAVAWHQLRVTDNDKLKSDIISKKLKMAQVKIDSGYMDEANFILKQMLGVKPIDSMYALVQKDKRTRPQIKDAEKMNASERQKQQQLLYAYNQHMAYAAPDSAFHPKYWDAYRRDCERLKEGDRHKKLTGIRLMDFAWHRCSENYWIFIGDQQYRQAAMSAKIWTILWPHSSWPSFLAAKAFAMQKRTPEMYEYLRQAMARGVKDKNRVATDPAFAEYVNTPEFKKIFQ